MKHEIEKQENRFLATLFVPMTTSLITPIASSLVKGIFGKGTMRAGRSVMRAGKGYENINHF